MTFSFIFDFDGVLANTMEVHFACYRQALAEAGVPISKEQFYFQAGMTGLEQIRYFCEKAGLIRNWQLIYDRKREIAQSQAGKASPIDCNLELLRSLRAQGHKAAIASGSSLQSVLPVVRHLGIDVDAIVTAEDVTRGKPHPDLFLAAARKLGVSAASCLVIEDSEVGIEAAQAAGMAAMRFHARPVAVEEPAENCPEPSVNQD